MYGIQVQFSVLIFSGLECSIGLLLVLRLPYLYVVGIAID